MENHKTENTTHLYFRNVYKFYKIRTALLKSKLSVTIWAIKYIINPKAELKTVKIKS